MIQGTIQSFPDTFCTNGHKRMLDLSSCAQTNPASWLSSHCSSNPWNWFKLVVLTHPAIPRLYTQRCTKHYKSTSEMKNSTNKGDWNIPLIEVLWFQNIGGRRQLGKACNNIDKTRKSCLWNWNGFLQVKIPNRFRADVYSSSTESQNLVVLWVLCCPLMSPPLDLHNPKPQSMVSLSTLSFHNPSPGMSFPASLLHPWTAGRGTRHGKRVIFSCKLRDVYIYIYYYILLYI